MFLKTSVQSWFLGWARAPPNTSCHWTPMPFLPMQCLKRPRYQPPMHLLRLREDFLGGKCFLSGISNEDVFIQDKISTGCLTNMEVLSKRRGLPNDSSVKWWPWYSVESWTWINGKVRVRISPRSIEVYFTSNGLQTATQQWTEDKQYWFVRSGFQIPILRIFMQV